MKAILKLWLQDTWAYELFSRFKGRQQEHAFSQLLLNAYQGYSGTSTSESHLLSLVAQRRPISNRPRVVGFGHDAWEQYGLWPTFRRISDFHHVSVDLNSNSWGAGYRKQAGECLLKKIDELDNQQPVEMVFMYCDSSFIDPDTLRKLAERGIWTVMMGLDDKHKFAERVEHGMRVGQSLVAPLVDLYWTTWKAGLPLFVKIGARSLYLAEGADPEFHRPLHLERDIDVLFLGQCYGRRSHLIRYLSAQGFDVQAYGRGWPNGFVTFEKSVELINRAKVVLGVGDVGHMSGVQHLKGRDFEVPMCGALYLTSYNHELADWYDIGREILCYSSQENCAEVLHWILGDAEKQESIRNAAIQRCLKEHTWEQRLQRVFNCLRHA
ncbi:MAG: hypothetical protein DDT19_01589 [Syntrophomonadaceae bacterium]|nr:hypothetical protein [Bacillota bacterium]